MWLFLGHIRSYICCHELAANLERVHFEQPLGVPGIFSQSKNTFLLLFWVIANIRVVNRNCGSSGLYRAYFHRDSSAATILFVCGVFLLACKHG